MRKWAFIIAGIVLLGAVVIILSTDSAPGTPVKFSRFETNVTGKVKAVFSVPGYPDLLFVNRQRIEQKDAMEWFSVKSPSQGILIGPGEVIFELPTNRAPTRVVFEVVGRTISDRLHDIINGRTPAKGATYSAPRYLVTNTLPVY